MTKQIYLSRGKVALVDDDLYEYLNQWKWSFDGRYATRAEKGKRVYMHRVVAQTPPGMETDHRSGDRLDNQRQNLRNATITQNRSNARKHHDNRTGFKGVSWSKQNKKWQAQIQVNGKKICIGFFSAPEDAAQAYDAKAKEKDMHGEFARTNF